MLYIILKHSENDYEDYREYNDAILQVYTTRTYDEVLQLHRDFLVLKLKENNINCKPNQPFAVAGRRKKGQTALHKEIVNTNPFLSWLRRTYNCVELTNIADHFTDDIYQIY